VERVGERHTSDSFFGERAPIFFTAHLNPMQHLLSVFGKIQTARQCRCVFIWKPFWGDVFGANSTLKDGGSPLSLKEGRGIIVYLREGPVAGVASDSDAGLCPNAFPG